jgi:predicted NAD/FAD-binding protein
VAAAAARRTVAVVGAGVSGLTAAYLLQRAYDVTLYESEPRLGGHAHTHDVLTPDERVLPIDSGFIVHNDRNYPYLLRLFDELGVATQPTDMSMSVRCDGCGLEYAGARGLGGVFADARNAYDPRFLRMLVEVKRFHRHARQVLDAPEPDPARILTLGDFLERERYSAYFVQHFMAPVVSCVWSCPPQTALLYPAKSLFEFLDHHGALAVRGSPHWRTVVGGSRTYVERAAKELTATALSTPVRRLQRTPQGVAILDDSDETRIYDHTVIATHADEALALLARPTPAEREVLGAFGYSANETILHTDGSGLPRHARARASWNYRLAGCSADAAAVQVSYDMNRLHRLDEPLDYVVTLNGGAQIRDEHVLARMLYTHPVYTRESVGAQARLAELNDGTLAYAGAYHGWGFHEDGCASGVRAAESLGVTW